MGRFALVGLVVVLVLGAWAGAILIESVQQSMKITAARDV